MKVFAITSSCLAALLLGLSANNSRAAVAYDDASQGAYSDGWATSDDGGYGFGSWNITGTGTHGTVVQSSAVNGGGSSGNINVSGVSWGLYADPGGNINAARSFDSALTLGQSLLLQMDNGWIDSGSVGFILLNSDNNNVFQFYFNAGASSYYIHDNRGWDQGTSLGFTPDGFDVSFQLTGANTYALTAGSYSYSGTLAGSGSIDEIQFYNSGAGYGANYNAYFNSLQVVPEPTHIALAIFGGIAGVGYGARRWFQRRQTVA
jgi:hypothetical protein